MTPVKLITISGDPEREAEWAARLDGHSEVELLLRCVDRMEALAAAGAGGLDAVLAVGLPGWLDRPTARDLRRSGARLIGLVQGDDAARLRAWEGSILPHSASVQDVLATCAVAPSETASPADNETQQSEKCGRLVAVWGPKGAPGRTTVALETATVLAQVEPRTLLLDGDPYGGDALQMLGVVEELPTILWASRMAEKGELEPADLLVDLRRAGREGPVLLPGIPRAELWGEVSEFGWRELLGVAKRSFEFVICDTGFCLEPDRSPNLARAARNSMARVAVAEADHVVAVCRADPVGIKRFLWSFEDVKEIISPESVTVVLNRCRGGAEREARTILHKHLGKRVAVAVPDKPAEFAKAVTLGRPALARGARRDLGDPIRQLACILGGRLPSRGFLTRLRGVTA